jgi:hypothetical protein
MNEKVDNQNGGLYRYRMIQRTHLVVEFIALDMDGEIWGKKMNFLFIDKTTLPVEQKNTKY